MVTLGDVWEAVFPEYFNFIWWREFLSRKRNNPVLTD